MSTRDCRKQRLGQVRSRKGKAGNRRQREAHTLCRPHARTSVADVTGRATCRCESPVWRKGHPRTCQRQAPALGSNWQRSSPNRGPTARDSRPSHAFRSILHSRVGAHLSAPVQGRGSELRLSRVWGYSACNQRRHVAQVAVACCSTNKVAVVLLCRGHGWNGAVCSDHPLSTRVKKQLHSSPARAQQTQPAMQWHACRLGPSRAM